MSEIKVDKLQGTSGTSTAITLSGANATVGGTLAVTGVHTVGENAIYDSEGGAVTQNLVQGLCKFFSNIDGDAGTVVARDSFNQASIIDRGTGDHSLTYTNNMNNNDYSTMNNADSASGHIAMSYSEGEQETSGVRVYIAESTNNNATDTNVVMTSLVGDLA